MIINGKPAAFIATASRSYDDWVTDTRIVEILTDFDFEDDTWSEFNYLIETSSEIGEKLALSERLPSGVNEVAAFVVAKLRGDKSYLDAVRSGIKTNENSLMMNAPEAHVMAALGWCEESCLNAFFYTHDRQEEVTVSSEKHSEARNPKYEINIDGTSHQWDGRGRCPSVFRDYVDGGGSLDDLAI